jgi:hypothetical protein
MDRQNYDGIQPQSLLQQAEDDQGTAGEQKAKYKLFCRCLGLGTSADAARMNKEGAESRCESFSPIVTAI